MTIKKPATFLEILDVALDPEGMTQEEMRLELEAMGVDWRAAEAKLEEHIHRCAAAAGLRRLDAARTERLAHRPRDLLADVKKLALSLEDIIQRIQQLDGGMAHRELEVMSRETLEAHLADLLALAPEPDPAS